MNLPILTVPYHVAEAVRRASADRERVQAALSRTAGLAQGFGAWQLAANLESILPASVRSLCAQALARSAEMQRAMEALTAPIAALRERFPAPLDLPAPLSAPMVATYRHPEPTLVIVFICPAVPEKDPTP